MRYALRVAVARQHRFARMRKVPLRRLQGEPLAAYARAEYTEYHEMLGTIFAALGVRGCRRVDTMSSPPTFQSSLSVCAVSLGALYGSIMRFSLYWTRRPCSMILWVHDFDC